MTTAVVPIRRTSKAVPVRGLLIAVAVSAGLWGVIVYGAYAVRLIFRF
jgi:hypothetical protein